jgi:hypothetical protein
MAYPYFRSVGRILVHDRAISKLLNKLVDALDIYAAASKPGNGGGREAIKRRQTGISNIKHFLGIEFVPVIASYQQSTLMSFKRVLTTLFQISPSQTGITCQRRLVGTKNEDKHL